MGQQQLLLLILGVIIVGIAIAIAITLFRDNAINSNRDAITNDLMDLASRAQQYYHKTLTRGGGGDSFTGLTIYSLTNSPSNLNGNFYVTSISPQEMVLTARGVYLEGADSVEVRCTVDPVAYTLEKIH